LRGGGREGKGREGEGEQEPGMTAAGEETDWMTWKRRKSQKKRGESSSEKT
jgi:hypothetical protein